MVAIINKKAGAVLFPVSDQYVDNLIGSGQDVLNELAKNSMQVAWFFENPELFDLLKKQEIDGYYFRIDDLEMRKIPQENVKREYMIWMQQEPCQKSR